jgi:hypothetical protein
VPATAVRRPAAVPVTIAACAALALALRAYQLSRPGHLLGVTEYDDGVLFGNALRLVSGVIPYRDFAMVQPPGSALLMVPVALLAKVTGTAWGLAIARILTVCADTANVVLLGVLAVALAAAGAAQFRAASGLAGTQVAAAADRLIPAGACVVTNDTAYTVAAGRFYSDVPGCPAMTDSFGTLIAMTSGHPRDASAAVLAPVVALWQATLARARYVWLTSNTVAQIPWNAGLDGYFRRHFRLIGFAGQPLPWRDVPRPGLYLRT